MVRNGLAPLAAKQALSGTLQLAQSQAISLQEAADIATTSMNGFNKSAEELTSINDALASTASNTATNVLELFEALKVAAPVATSAGVSMEETMAVLGQLANKGFRGSEAGTGLKQIILALASQTPEAEKVAKKYGFAVDETTIKTKGLIEVLKELSSTGLGSSIADMGEYFNKLAAPKGAAILGDTAMLEELYQTISKSQGEAARMFEEGIGEWEKAYKTLLSVWENTQIKVFESGRSVFTQPLNYIAEFLRRIQDIPTLATAAFGVLATKISGIFSKTYKELDKIGEKQFKEKLLKNQNAYQNASIAHSATSAAQNIPLNPSVKDGYIQLQKELQAVAQKYDTTTKSGIILKKALNDLDTIVNSNRTSTKKYQKAISDLNVQMTALGNKARHTNLSVISSNLQNCQRQSVTFGNTVKGVFTKLATAAKSLGSGIMTLLGGPVGVITTIITLIGTYLVSAYRKSTQAVRDAEKAMSDARQKNDNLNSSFTALVETLRRHEQSSAVWQAAMSKLKREYPELLEKLHLEQISVRQSADEYENLQKRIKGVIQWQKKYNMAEAALQAKEGLVNDIDSKYWENNKHTYQGLTKGSNQAVFDIEFGGLQNDIKSIISQYGSKSKDSVIKELSDAIQLFLKNTNGKVNSNDKTFADMLANKYYKQFEKQDQRLSTYEKYISAKEDEPITSELVDALIKEASNSFNLEREKLQQKSDAQKWDKEQLNSAIAQSAKQFLDEITDKLQNTSFTNKKGDKKNGLEYGRATKEYQALLQQSKLTTKIEPTDSETKIKSAQEQYASTMAFATRQLELGYINQLEYNRKHLTAIQHLINSYETNDDIVALNSDEYKKLIEQQKSLIQTLSEQEQEAEKAKDKIRQNKSFERKNDRISKSYDNIIQGRGKEKINKWDYLDFDSLQEGKQKEEQVRIEYLKNQLDELKELRSNISDEEIKKAKELSSVAGDELISWVDKLDDGIIKLGEHVTNLNDSFQLNKAREELKELRKEIGDRQYEAVKLSIGAIVELKDSIESFKDFGKLSTWEQFETITSTIFATIDTIKNLIDTWTNLNQILEIFGIKSTALTAIEQGNSVAKIAAIQGEAAAVVAAETTKTTAIEAALATQTATNLAAKAVQIGAAKALMAAESAAAYAAIPFAGVGLAAAQIAEMQALITSAALIPTFADGGIIGGSKYIGDQNLARVNSGEMIINGSQQKRLWDAISNNKLQSGSSGGEVNFKIKGTELFGVLKNYNNKMSKI